MPSGPVTVVVAPLVATVDWAIVPLNTAVSVPAPPSIVSLPRPPLMTSSPPRPLMVSAPEVPASVSALGVPSMAPPPVMGAPAISNRPSANCSRSTLVRLSVPSGPVMVVTPLEVLIV